MRNLAWTSKKCIYFSFRTGWARKMLRLIKNIFREITIRFLTDYQVICLVFGWFVGGLQVVWLVCGQFGWFVSGLAGLWVVSSFTANNKSSGVNNVSFNIIKKMLWGALQTLYLFQLSLENGIFSDDLKIAKVTLICKAGDCGDISNYKYRRLQ